jgi:uncharacterized repeat protein (TIGR03803 family)
MPPKPSNHHGELPLHPKRFSLGMTTALAIFALAIVGTQALAIPNETVLYSFAGGNDGSHPYASLVFDVSGNLYGTTFNGGAYEHGTVFELSPAAGGTWTEKVLHSFLKNIRADGIEPYAGLIIDGFGNLYGTTQWGGSDANRGTAFELTPQADGDWTETGYVFTGKYGNEPVAGLIFDKAGNLYGTAVYGGYRGGGGTVFELTPEAGGWTAALLHSFTKRGNDGSAPRAGLIFDGAGNLYGTTSGGGAQNAGTVFELMPKTGGGWTEKVLHTFGKGKDGQYPYGALILNAAGILYGTTSQGGTYQQGTVFELTHKTNGGWSEKILHSFNNNGKDGIEPYAALVADATGNLYGTTLGGGAHVYGTVFKLTPKAGGGWTENILHSFSGGNDGAGPYAALIFDTSGNLYGATIGGGSAGVGTVFKITP